MFFGRRSLVLVVLLVALLPGCVDDAWRPRGSARTTEPIPLTLHGPASAMVGDVVTFSARAEGVGADEGLWLWDFGDGTRAEDVGLAIVGHEFAEPGRFRVSLFVHDREGRRGVAAFVVSVNQLVGFEGTVSRGLPASEREPVRSTFEARADLSNVRLEVTFTRAHPVSAVADVTPPRVTVRLLAPENAEAARGGNPVLLQASVAVGEDGETLRAVVPGSRVLKPGGLVLEIVPEEGEVRYRATSRLEYGHP